MLEVFDSGANGILYNSVANVQLETNGVRADGLSAEIMALKFSLGSIGCLALVDAAIRLFELPAPDVPVGFDRAAEHSVDRCYCGI